MIAATIVARNYAAHARVLAASYILHHPTARFVTLVIDGEDHDRESLDGVGSVVLPADLDLSVEDWQQMAAVYSILELATALKPSLLRWLLDGNLVGSSDPSAVVYLDPDIVVYHPFSEVLTAAERSGIALTPHVLHPLPRDGLEPDERALMHAGLFNLGFIAVGQDARPFLDWWHERLRLDAIVDPLNGLFTDQRWVDWIPSLFTFAVLRDHGLNVAYWNGHERPLSLAADGTVLAAGSPLKFFHFSGYDPRLPWILSKHAQARPRCTVADNELIAKLCQGYAESLAAAGLALQRQVEYGLEFAPNGLRLTPSVRTLYRSVVKDAINGGPPPPPSPFASDGGAGFTAWLTAAFGPPELGLTRWHHELWRQRPDLQAHFPHPGGVDALPFREWLDSDPSAIAAHTDLRLPSPVEPHLPSAPSSGRVDRGGPSPAPYGWNVVGYHAAELGVGEAGRRMQRAIEGAGIPTQLVAISAPGSRQHHRIRQSIRSHLVHQRSLYCVNADQLPHAVAQTRVAGPPAASSQRRRIGMWFWEVDQFPDRWMTSFDLVDEVWCASQFTADTLRAVAPVPVRVVPLPVWAPLVPTPFTRRQLGLPDGFVFLCSFDFNSVFERKNPIGAIEAYTRAFGPREGASLVLKSINGSAHPSQVDRLQQAAMGREDIIFTDEYLDAHRVQGLIERADCMVSLHRSEGFGLNLAAAMAAGRPVIATGYSGNLDFMAETSAYLVPHDLVPVGPGHDPYPATACWADPDLDSAAALMRRVFDDPAGASQVAARGREAVLLSHGIERVSAAVGNLLLESELWWSSPEAVDPTTVTPLAERRS